MLSIHEIVKRDREAALPDAKDVEIYRRYAEGKQDLALNWEQRRILGAVCKHEFADNLCDLTLATAAARLEFTGWDVDDEPAQKFLDTIYTKNQLADFSYDGHYRTVRDGNHAIGLRWTSDDAKAVVNINDDGYRQPSGRVTLHHEPWWDGGDTGVFIAFDSGNEPTYAVKDFKEIMGDPPRARLRRTVYFPDHFEKYIKDGQGWAPYPDSASFSADWTKKDGSPLGIPIVLLANNRFGRAPYGASDLAGGLIGLQDEINDIQRDITAAARLTAFQMATATGIDGAAASKMRIGPGELIWAEGPAARIGWIPAGDMSQLISAHDKKVATFAQNTRTPLHLITGGDWPSGAALLRAESPLVSKVTQLAKSVGPGWSTIGHRSTEIFNAFGRGGLNEDALITAQFAPPEKLDEGSFQEIQTAKVAMMMQLGLIEDETLLKATGVLDDKQIKALMAERKTRQNDALALASIGGFQDQSQQQQPPVDANGNPIDQKGQLNG